jgi:hypothetical protein
VQPTETAFLLWGRAQHTLSKTYFTSVPIPSAAAIASPFARMSAFVEAIRSTGSGKDLILFGIGRIKPFIRAVESYYGQTATSRTNTDWLRDLATIAKTQADATVVG